jgi:hypothetical protein
VNRVALALTKRWLRLQGDEFLRIATIELPEGKEEQVAVFSGNTYYMIGQVTPWGTILIHEFAFLSEKLYDYVVAHESAHKRQWFRYLLYPLMMLWLILPFSFLSIVLMIIQAVITGQSIYLGIAVTTLIVSAVLLAIPMLFSWGLEFLADCYAIRKVGMSNILDAIEECRALAKEHGYKKPSRLSIMLARLTHPPLSLTYRICRFLHRNEIDPAPMNG